MNGPFYLLQVHSLNKLEGLSHRFQNDGSEEEERMTVLPDIKQVN